MQVQTGISSSSYNSLPYGAAFLGMIRKVGTVLCLKTYELQNGDQIDSYVALDPIPGDYQDGPGILSSQTLESISVLRLTDVEISVEEQFEGVAFDEVGHGCLILHENDLFITSKDNTSLVYVNSKTGEIIQEKPAKSFCTFHSWCVRVTTYSPNAIMRRFNF